MFCENFNFSFGSAKSDTCKTLDCCIKDCVDDESKLAFMKELEDHHDLAELEFKSLHDDAELARSEPDAYTVISFDLHQNLPTPHKRVLYFIYDNCGFTILEFIMLAIVMDICVCGLAMVTDIL